MAELKHDLNVRLARGPDGQIMCLHNLPPPSTTRWVVRRKAEVVYAVRGGLISVEDACARYRLHLEEYQAWEKAVQVEGVTGLRATRPREGRRTVPSKGT